MAMAREVGQQGIGHIRLIGRKILDATENESNVDVMNAFALVIATMMVRNECSMETLNKFLDEFAEVCRSLMPPHRQ